MHAFVGARALDQQAILLFVTLTVAYTSVMNINDRFIVMLNGAG